MRERFAESLQLSRDLGNSLRVAHILARLDGIPAARAGRERAGQVRAAQVLAAATTMQEGSEAVGAPLERQFYDRALATLRAALGEEVFAHAWAAGQALPLEAAISLALEEPG